MTSCCFTAAALAIAFLPVVTAASRNLPADGKLPPVSVSVEDIGTKVQLIGRLDQPLGKMMTVSGRWFYSSNTAMPESSCFVVTHVNQKKLAKEVGYDVGLMHVTSRDGKKVIPGDWREQEKLDGQKWTLRVYETGRLFLEPKEFREELGHQVVQMPCWTRPFVSELHGYVVTE